MIPTERFEQVEVAYLDALRAWLADNHQHEESVWLIRNKKSVSAKFIDRLDLLDELLCYGWIDGVARRLDDQRTMQLISPRKQQAWAQSFKDRVARLGSQGRMMAPGLAALDRSKKHGLWDSTAAAAPSCRRNVLRWISQAKTSETRARRIATTIDRFTKGDKILQM